MAQEQEDDAWTEVEITHAFVDAQQFYRAGGTVSLHEWAEITPSFKAVLCKASAHVELERIKTLARSILFGPNGMKPAEPPSVQSALKEAAREALRENWAC